MESAEIDIALEELESRLERLRALYEQYFMGIEKLEPAIPRKDVDRRIYVLRREKIRNTGKRFKLQTLISRYNTFQQYWQRICREIENGTYKRHLLRAEKNFGPNQLLTTAAKRRFGRQMALRDSQRPEAAADAAAQQAEVAAAPPADTASAAATGVQETALRPRSRTPTWPGIPTPPPPSGAAPPPPPPPLYAEAIAPVRVPAGVQRPAAASPLPPAMAAAPATPAPRAAPSSPPRKSTPFESLELDMDFMGDWDPGAAAKGRSAVGASPGAPERTAARRSPVAQTPPREKPPAANTPAQQPRAAEPRVAAPPAEPRAAAPIPARTPLSSFPLPGEARRLAPPPKPKRDPALAPPPASSIPPAQPSPERRPPVQRPPTERPPAPRPASENPAAAAAAAAARARAARPRAAPAEANVTEGKLRALHQRLAEVSKSAGQPTVSFDGLSKSLRAAEAKLRAKHGDRRIDFEVVLKDGKPVVKPVVR